MTARRDAHLIERLLPLALTLGVIVIATLTLYPTRPSACHQSGTHTAVIYSVTCQFKEQQSDRGIY